jgi:cyclophilin family peptidyl-prolyl cis-trans isomerase
MTKDVPTKKTPAREEPVAPSMLQQINETFQKNAKIVIVVASALIVVVIFLIASHFWGRVRSERGLSEVEEAENAVQLEALRAKYKGTAEIESMILYRLGSLHYQEGSLEKAQETYREFKKSYPQHTLLSQVEKALQSIQRDLEFFDNDKEVLTSHHSLWVHPSKRKDKSPFGPHPTKLPFVSLEITQGSMQVEMYPQDAPKGTEHFLGLAGKEYFKDLKFVKRADGKGWIVEEKKSGAATDELAFEPTTLPVVKGTIALVRKEGDAKNLPGRFQIFTQDAPELQDQVTVIGQITGVLTILDKMSADDAIRMIRVLGSTSVDFKPIDDHHGHGHDHDHHDHKH